MRGIERPLKKALEKFYQERAVKQLETQLPPDLAEEESIKEAIGQLIYTDGLMPEERYVAPGDMLAALRSRYPGKFDDIDLTPQEPQAAGGKSSPNSELDSRNKAEPSPAVREFSKDAMIRLFIWRPLADDERMKLDALGVQEPFVIYIKAGFLAGAVISSPAVFYFIWQFVAAGLYPHEKRYIHLFLPFSLALFLSGAALAFFAVFPPVLNFFFGIAESLGTEMRPRLSEWLSFVLLLPLGFGVSFQLPLVMLFLERIHVFSVQAYLSKWRIAVLIMAIMAMVLSPGGDPYSMMMMLVPLVGLYFAGVGLCKWMPSRRGPAVRPASH